MSKTMSTMNKDEKRLMLFDMQEHPEKYTDEQVERLLADEEAQEFLRDLAMARMAGKKSTPKKVDVDKAWKEFSVVFDNAELGTILTQMADFYHVKVRYDNADTQHVRLFFNWNKTKTLEQNLAILNAFDRIQIEYAEGELVVK